MRYQQQLSEADCGPACSKRPGPHRGPVSARGTRTNSSLVHEPDAISLSIAGILMFPELGAGRRPERYPGERSGNASLPIRAPGKSSPVYKEEKNRK